METSKTSSSKSQRHWRVLRNALLRSASTASSGATASSISTEFFPVFSSRVAQSQPKAEAAADHVWTEYELSSATNKDASSQERKIIVHEKRKDTQRVSIAEILSHKVHQGVDNTGNIRTWPSEQILLKYMLQSGLLPSVQRRNAGELVPLNCCELGAGMAGLAGLGVLVCAPVQLQRVLITDGNPLCVKNLQRCIEENKARSTITSRDQVTAELLRWDRNAVLRPDLLHQFDLVFASDCLFFEEFHEDLAHTIKKLLRDGSSRCLLLQPSRSRSMERFCAIAERHGLRIDRSEDYDASIVQKHNEYQQARPDYLPDVHFPVLLTLRIERSE